MKVLGKVKKVVYSTGIALAMLPSKIFAVEREQSVLYGPPEDYTNITTNVTNTVSKTKETAATFEPDSMFFIRCLTFFLIPLIFLIGLIIYSKKSKNTKGAKALVIVFMSLLIIAMLTGAILFVVGSIQGWF